MVGDIHIYVGHIINIHKIHTKNAHEYMEIWSYGRYAKIKEKCHTTFHKVAFCWYIHEAFWVQCPLCWFYAWIKMRHAYDILTSRLTENASEPECHFRKHSGCKEQVKEASILVTIVVIHHCVFSISYIAGTYFFFLVLNGQSSSDNCQDDEKCINIVSKFSIYTTWVRETFSCCCCVHFKPCLPNSLFMRRKNILFKKLFWIANVLKSAPHRTQ